MMFSFFSVEYMMDASGFVPRAVCGSWTRGEVLLNNAADLAVALAYLAIPFILLSLQRRRPDFPFSWVLAVFGLFIITCGATHVFEIILFYHPIYRAAGLVKVITAIASWAAVGALVKILPALVVLRSPQELEAMNAELAAEIERRRKAEEQQEVLIRELHHRVKNNLQTVSSLLQLQEASSSSKEEVLRESSGRIRALAAVHESLYLSDDLSKVSMESYLHRLCEAVTRSTAPLSKITVTAPVFMDTDTAVPCGLVVNELVTNSLKHGRKGGAIEVRLTEQGDDFTLCVADNGPGFGEHPGEGSVESLGLRLVKALVGQLEGTAEFENDNGAVVRIVFPRPEGDSP